VADKGVLKVEDEKMGEQGHEMDLESDGTLRCVHIFFVAVVSELN
jgi:hypothetical protein